MNWFQVLFNRFQNSSKFKKIHLKIVLPFDEWDREAVWDELLVPGMDCMPDVSYVKLLEAVTCAEWLWGESVWPSCESVCVDKPEDIWDIRPIGSSYSIGLTSEIFKIIANQ